MHEENIVPDVNENDDVASSKSLCAINFYFILLHNSEFAATTYVRMLDHDVLFFCTYVYSPQQDHTTHVHVTTAYCTTYTIRPPKPRFAGTSIQYV